MTKKLYKVVSILLTLALFLSFAGIISQPVLALPAEKYDLSGWTKSPHEKWSQGELMGYTELEWVDFQLEVTNYAGDNTSFDVLHDYLNGDKQGFADAGSFAIAGFTEGTHFTVTTPAPDGEHLKFTVTFTDRDAFIAANGFTFTWSAQLAGPNQASDSRWGNIQTVIGIASNPGNQTVSVKEIAAAVPTPAPAISVTKTAQVDGPVYVDDVVTYDYTVTNTGNVELTDLTLVDDKIGTITLPVTTLAAGASTTGTGQYTVLATDLTAGSVVNIATATATYNQTPVTGNDTESVVVTTRPVDPKGTLIVTKALSNEDPQSGVTFKLHKGTGDGRTTLTGVTNDSGLVTFSDLVPDDDYYLEEVVPANYTTDLNPNPKQLTIVAGVNEKYVMNTYHPPVLVAGMTLEKTGPATARVGDQITYTFTITNTGTYPLFFGSGENKINDDVLGEIYFTSELDEDSEIKPGQSISKTVQYTIPDADPDPLVNNAWVEAAYGEEQSITARDSHSVDIIGDNPPPVDKPAISLTKTAAPTAVHVGDTITYSYKITNTGDLTLFDLSLSDDKLGSISLTDTTLEPDEFTTATATYAAKDSDVGTLTNTATTKGYYESELVLYYEGQGLFVEDTDSASVTVSRRSNPKPHDHSYPGIKLEKAASVTQATTGDLVTYTYSVTNTGDYTLNDIIVSDDKLGSIILAKTTLKPGEKTTGTASYTVKVSDLPGPLVNEAKAKGIYSSTSSIESALSKATVLLYSKPVVVPPEPPVVAPPAPPLPYTGGNTALFVSAGLCLAGIGAFLRRRF